MNSNTKCSTLSAESATHHDGPALHFQLRRIERSLQEMDVAVVGLHHQLAIGPLGMFVSADQQFQSDLLEDGVVQNFKLVSGKSVLKLDRNWNIATCIGFGKPGDPVFNTVHDIAVGRDGSIYVAETRTKRVVKLRPVK